MNKILVFGHKNPDTDSVCAAISMSNLKNELGFKTEPRVLGDINNETKYVLDFLNIECPKYLNDVKLQIKDINYRKKFYLNEKESLLKAFKYMDEKDISTVPIVDSSLKFTKALAMKDIARNQVTGNLNYLSTSYDHIVEALNGEKVLKFDEEITGILASASLRSSTLSDTIDIPDCDILITGDLYRILDYSIKKNIKLLVVTSDYDIKKKYINQAIKNKINIIKTPYDGFNVSIKIGLSNYIRDLSYTKKLMCINDNDYVSDVLKLTKETRYSYYPIIDKNDICLGLLKVADLNDKSPKKVILVDHNEHNQSADGIDEAEIVEIVDHHKIGTIGTFYPINFRNMPVGSSNTIIYQMYKEERVKITKKMAAVMLSGILSDTLILNSPTTTADDKEAVLDLAKISGLDYKEYGMNMLRAGSNLEGKSINEIIYQDFKSFDSDDIRIGIGQVLTTEPDKIIAMKDKIIEELNVIAKGEQYDILTLFVTDIINDGSYLLYSNNSYDKIKNSFKKDLSEGVFLKDYVSRKKQILPAIMKGIAK